ncbi:MAG: hypothetical protein IPO87_04105 [Flavobacteriales bacterium]|nr:hypothetical protein [Flavobacteriales bacterium]
MIRSLVTCLLICASVWSIAAPFTIHVSSSGHDDDVVSLYRYDDLFTLRGVLLTRGLLNSEGMATLEGEVEQVTKMYLRIGERTADLYVAPGSDLNVVLTPMPGALSLNGTSRMVITFTGMDPMDVNALSSDLNERIDAFISEDLATDETAGMQALDIKRKDGGTLEDSTKRPPTLFVTPLLSANKVDSFTTKLRRFYAEAKDPWFAHYLNYSIAGLYAGPRTKESDLFKKFLEGKPVLYNDPEYVRFIRNFFSDQLDQLARTRGDSLTMFASTGNAEELRKLFQHNDFLRTSDQLAELVMIDQLYRKYAIGLVDQNATERLLAKVGSNSKWPEHRTIASNMLWDLLAMRPGSVLSQGLRLETPSGTTADLESLLVGPVCIALTAGWCTACGPEIAGLIKLDNEYPGAITVVVIGLDKSLDEFNVARKTYKDNKLTWIHAAAEQELREQLRVRSLPMFYLLNGNELARSPAPLPSEGLGALFHQAKVAADQKVRVKVWDD